MILHQRELIKFREEIDAVDVELLALIQKRFSIVDRVIVVKQAAKIPAMLPDRIEQVVQNVLRSSKGAKVPPQAIEKLWRALIAETIAYEEKILNAK